jgi:tetratricopeptide (TPR) repeat protein
MDIDLRKNVVGIRAKFGLPARYAGTGFLVEGGWIVTCAHVLKEAERAAGMVRFCFEDEERFYQAEVVFAGDPFEPGQDVAILKPANLPDSLAAPALPLVASAHSQGHTYRTFGYPAAAGGKGIFASGQIEGVKPGELQISSNKITHGCSGAPIWDESAAGVVGMVNAGFDFGLEKKLGDVVFALPAESLKAAFPALQISVTSHPSPTRPGDLPPGSYLPIQPNPNFTGRAAELTQLAEALLNASGGAVVNQQALVGMGGLGKTQLAAQFAWQEGCRFTGIHWVSAYQREQAGLSVDAIIKDSIVQCGREMNLPGWVEGDRELERQVSLTLAAWKQSGPRLVILDNLEDLPAASLWMAKLRHSNIRILVTTRQKDWPPDLGLRQIGLLTFTLEESLAFLRRSLDEARASPADLRALHDRLGGLPLPLDLAAAYLVHVSGLTVPQYLEQLNLEHPSLKNWRARYPTATRHDKDLAATFALSWERVESQAARGLFRLAGYGLPNEPLPQEVLQAAAELDQAAYSEALDLLQGLSLLQPETSLHPLLAEFARLQDGGRAALFRWARVLAWRGYPGFEHGGIYRDPALARYLRLSLPDLLRAVDVTGTEAAERSTLCLHTAFLLTHFGDLDGALKLYQQSLEISEGLGDLKGKSTTLHNIAGIYVTRGDLDRALKLYQQSLALNEGLGDLKGKSNTLAMMAQIDALQNNFEQSLIKLVNALNTNIQLGAKPGIQSMIQNMKMLKSMMDASEFDALWQAVTGQPLCPTG